MIEADYIPVLDESRAATLSEIGPKGVAMNCGWTCGSCRHLKLFDRPIDDYPGRCGKAHKGDGLAKATDGSDYDAAALYVRENFGCVQWEAKDRRSRR